MKDRDIYRNSIRGCIFGGAVGDALGYPIEFMREEAIRNRFGSAGLTTYILDSVTRTALISDDTQMSLFTANGILVGDTRVCLRGIGAEPRAYVEKAYLDWLYTQDMAMNNTVGQDNHSVKGRCSWLLDVPELFNRRAPGNTCLTALWAHRNGVSYHDYLASNNRMNDSKGCGGIMRVAPLAVYYHMQNLDCLDMEGAQISAITHGHSLGYMPSAVLVHIINRIVYSRKNVDLKTIFIDARDSIGRLFKDRNIYILVKLIDKAIELSENKQTDSENIRMLGEGWVAEETLAIAMYCSLRYANDFLGAVIASVSHNGDSDSTGAVTGNIMGAWLGYSAIDDKWKDRIELKEIILEIADDLCSRCQMSEYGQYRDDDWLRKYVEMHKIDR